MKTVISVLCFSAFLHLHAQTGVTFKLNPLPLEHGERIIVRGSFNNWSGTDHELTKLPGEDLYVGDFILKEEPGDTIQYKFVLLRGDGSDYWERNPNPANTDYGNRTAVIRPRGTELPVATFDLDEFFRYPVVFSKEKLQEDFVQMRQLLEEIHPALYAYTEKEVLDSIFEQGYQKIGGPMGFSSFYTLLSEVVAPIGCGHTSLWVPSDFWKLAPDRFFPLKLAVLRGGVFVTGDYGVTVGVPPGSEITSVNGRSIQEIIREFEPAVSADGFNRSNVIKRIERDFSKKYARLAEPIPRAENHFTGNLFTLIDGHGFSTTGHFCSLLKYHGLGQFVGSELGATYTCTGNVEYIDLEHTRILLGTARVSRYNAAVEDMDPMRGVMPDFPVEPSQQDIVNGTDRVMEFALSLASEKSD